MFVIVGNSSFEGGVSWKGSIHSVPRQIRFFHGTHAPLRIGLARRARISGKGCGDA
jgi:hypothetical protein